MCQENIEEKVSQRKGILGGGLLDNNIDQRQRGEGGRSELEGERPCSLKRVMGSLKAQKQGSSVFRFDEDYFVWNGGSMEMDYTHMLWG